VKNQEKEFKISLYSTTTACLLCSQQFWKISGIQQSMLIFQQHILDYISELHTSVWSGNSPRRALVPQKSSQSFISIAFTRILVFTLSGFIIHSVFNFYPNTSFHHNLSALLVFISLFLGICHKNLIRQTTLLQRPPEHPQKESIVISNSEGGWEGWEEGFP